MVHAPNRAEAKPPERVLSAFLPLTSVLANDLHKLACRVKDTDAVGETRMACTGIDQLGKTQLLDAPQSLKWPRLQYPPKSGLQLVARLKFDQVMQRIPNALGHGRKAYPGRQECNQR